MFGKQRAREGAGPATVAVDISMIGTVMTHSAAVHGIAVNTEAVTLAWSQDRRVAWHYIAPGKAQQNGFIEFVQQPNARR